MRRRPGPIQECAESKAATALVLCLLNGWSFVAPGLACGEARGGSIPRSGAVTDEQRSHRPNWAQPEGRQFFSLQASLLAPYRSTAGYARRSRLAWSENPLPQNTSHFGDTTLGPLNQDSPKWSRSWWSGPCSSGWSGRSDRRREHPCCWNRCAGNPHTPCPSHSSWQNPAALPSI
jgi:hypothetical protein